MSAIDRFEINTSNYLGLDYSTYKNDLYALALSKPSDYFVLRKNTLKIVKEQAIANIYKSFYNLLLKGQDIDGNDIPDLGSPGFPAQEVSKIALQASKSLDNMLEKIIQIILPLDFKELATKRLEEQSKQNF